MRSTIAILAGVTVLAGACGSSQEDTEAPVIASRAQAQSAPIDADSLERAEEWAHEFDLPEGSTFRIANVSRTAESHPEKHEHRIYVWVWRDGHWVLLPQDPEPWNVPDEDDFPCRHT